MHTRLVVLCTLLLRVKLATSNTLKAFYSASPTPEREVIRGCAWLMMNWKKNRLPGAPKITHFRNLTYCWYLPTHMCNRWRFNNGFTSGTHQMMSKSISNFGAHAGCLKPDRFKASIHHLWVPMISGNSFCELYSVRFSFW